MSAVALGFIILWAAGFAGITLVDLLTTDKPNLVWNCRLAFAGAVIITVAGVLTC